MKIAIFGRKAISERLVTLLTEQGSEVEINPGLQNKAGIDLAIIDSLSEDVESMSHHIRNLWKVPLLLIVNEGNSNWEKLYSIHADGYLRERTKGPELKARLDAILRGLPLRTNTMHVGHTIRDSGHNFE